MNCQDSRKEEPPNQAGPDSEVGCEKLIVMGILAVLSLMVALDACVIVTSLPEIVKGLETNTSGGFWIGTSYLLANAVAMLFIADLSEAFGRKPCLTVSVAFFTIGTIICCLSDTIAQMLTGRSLQGIGGAGIMMLSIVIYTDLVSQSIRPKWYGIILGAWALGNCLGPIIGGVIAQHTTWRWVFYIMFPFCAVGMVLVPWKVNVKPRSKTTHEKLAMIDWAGGVLFISSSTLFLVAISGGGIQSPWNSVGTLAPLCLGIAGFVSTLVYETRVTQKPFLNRNLFWGPSPIAVYICGAVQGLLLYGQLYYIPQFFILVKGFSPVNTGLALLPVMFTLMPGSIATGFFITRTENCQYPIWAGWMLTTIATGLTILWDANTPASVWATTLVLLGLGHGAVLNAQTTAASQAAFSSVATVRGTEPNEGIATAMYAFLRQFGMAVGVGIGGSTFQNVFLLNLDMDGLPGNHEAKSQVNVAELLQVVIDSSARAEILDACILGLRGVSCLYVGLSGAALFVSMWVKRYHLNQFVTTEQKLQNSGKRVLGVAEAA
ncbi:major facilitator superfamily transporter (efflux pump antibiotic resistance) [Colletotrichum truncatum]|uniref:Major facilitator superfamily transporter (Efflux pump antibiotic resistance) n=1 Tax=Colletotrichum truncatum TaxID=5467 RepID=A0ACC3YCQ5_COLTU|nr:major facilitator superfamily transporter (efflux pump antibiotic resistance) [Colletotrichum truncatum]KAF6794007.1 major facilitator superfamily transporter (efflux pump antibiotic resistance) [Colletotrichum truncatum]